ncbi:uncharacterized protein LOC109862358 [Pseudomyrmex gracilis]|uniref:uncharacterized protein LOC109862358 n=1 Tax=Pseudomyrmex gracilis TaxID=219809 RepID=UPI0009955A8D|nr:uncharacterized protein LOC109862358 [Pseudomyrmex gracilis]
MTQVQPSTIEQQKQMCYLLHHGVLRAASQTTKLRVVFNGSQQTSAGASLNQCLLVGPNLLPALADVITRWRCHRYVMISDVEKMYRQIKVHPDDRNLQRILWKSNSSIEEYQVNTVTYGLACAPFLAIRTLKQLANDEEAHFPEGAAALRRDVYVDDVLTGAQSLGEAIRLRSQLQGLCKAGGFPLRKWASNAPSLVDDLPPDLCAQQSRSWQSGELHSALGLQWDPYSDCFAFVINLRPRSTTLTKRNLLSETAQLFDPLGWLSPVSVSAKLLIQTTWLQRLDRDDQLQEEKAAQWTRFREELSSLNSVRVPR